MGRSLLFLSAALLSVAALFSGCLKATHRLDGEVHLELPSSSWALPLAEVQLSTNDLPVGFASALTEDASGRAYVWEQVLEPTTLALGAWLTWPDWATDVQVAVEPDAALALNSLPAGANYAIDWTGEAPFESPEGTVVKRIVFQSGLMRCAPEPSSPWVDQATIVVPELTVQGQPLTWTVGAQPVELDLTGMVLELPAGQTHLNLHVSLALISPGTPLPQGATFGWSLEWQEIIPDLIEGDFTGQTPAVAQGSMDLTVPTWLAGPAGLADPRMELVVENGQGVQLDCAVEGLLEGALGSTPFAWTPAGSASVLAAPLPGETSTTTLTLDNSTTTPSIGIWASPDLTGMAYEVTAAVAGPSNQFLTRNGRITVLPSIALPFIGYAARLTFKDTVPCDLEAAISAQLPEPLAVENISRITLRFEATNGLPLALATQIRFLDGSGEPVDSLFVEATTILEPATTALAAAGHLPVSPGVRSWDAVFDAATAMRLVEAGVQDMEVEVTGCTPGAEEGRPVVFGPDQTLSIRAALRVDATFEQP